MVSDENKFLQPPVAETSLKFYIDLEDLHLFPLSVINTTTKSKFIQQTVKQLQNIDLEHKQQLHAAVTLSCLTEAQWRV